MAQTTYPEKCCRNCRFLDVKPDKLGRRIVRRQETYDCLVPLAPPPPLPASLPQSTFATYRDGAKWGMNPDEGETCPLFEPLKKETA